MVNGGGAKPNAEPCEAENSGRHPPPVRNLGCFSQRCAHQRLVPGLGTACAGTQLGFASFWAEIVLVCMYLGVCGQWAPPMDLRTCYCERPQCAATRGTTLPPLQTLEIFLCVYGCEERGQALWSLWKACLPACSWKCAHALIDLPTLYYA